MPKIPNLQASGVPDVSNELIIVQDGVTKRVRLDRFLESIVQLDIETSAVTQYTLVNRAGQAMALDFGSALEGFIQNYDYALGYHVFYYRPQVRSARMVWPTNSLTVANVTPPADYTGPLLNTNTTEATSGNEGRYGINNDSMRISAAGQYASRNLVQLSQVNACRMLIGLRSGNDNDMWTTVDPTHSNAVVALVYDSRAGANWRILLSNGLSSPNELFEWTDTGVAADTSMHDIGLVVDPETEKVYVFFDGVLMYTKSVSGNTSYPSTSITLSHVVSLTPSENVAKVFTFGGSTWVMEE